MHAFSKPLSRFQVQVGNIGASCFSKPCPVHHLSMFNFPGLVDAITIHSSAKREVGLHGKSFAHVCITQYVTNNAPLFSYYRLLGTLSMIQWTATQWPVLGPY